MLLHIACFSIYNDVYRKCDPELTGTAMKPVWFPLITLGGGALGYSVFFMLLGAEYFVT